MVLTGLGFKNEFGGGVEGGARGCLFGKGVVAQGRGMGCMSLG